MMELKVEHIGAAVLLVALGFWLGHHKGGKRGKANTQANTDAAGWWSYAGTWGGQ